MKNTYHQKSGRKLLMNFDYYSYKYIATMEYHNITILLEKTNDQPSKLKTRVWVEVNDVSNGN